MNRGISAGVSNWMVGAAEPSAESPTGFLITEISVINLEPCVPRSIADAAIDGYQDFWDSFDTIFDPATSDPELLAETTTGGYRSFATGLIDDFRRDGQILRGQPTTAPEFFEIASVTELVIVDCQDVNPELGVYVAATGERTDIVPPIEEGELDLQQATMVVEGGIWKIEDLQGAGDVECRTTNRPQTLTIAGG